MVERATHADTPARPNSDRFPAFSKAPDYPFSHSCSHRRRSLQLRIELHTSALRPPNLESEHLDHVVSTLNLANHPIGRQQHPLFHSSRIGTTKRSIEMTKPSSTPEPLRMPIEIWRSEFPAAITFYQRKAKQNKSRYFFWSRTAILMYWTGALLLTLIAYNIFDPMLTFLGRSATSTTYFYFFSSAPILPTLLIAGAAAINGATKKRGYFNAWMRSTLTLSTISCLKSKTEGQISAAEPEQKKQEAAQHAIEELASLIMKERADFAKAASADLPALFTFNSDDK